MSLFRVEGATPDENDESTEHSLAAKLAAVRATAEEAQTTVDESAAQYQILIREQVDFHANYVPAFDQDPAFAAAPAPYLLLVADENSGGGYRQLTHDGYRLTCCVRPRSAPPTSQ